MSRRAVVAHHGHCFDGMASAVVFTRLLEAVEGERFEATYRGLGHQPGGSFVPRDLLQGDVNAVLDFRYTTAPELTWYFDHHDTGIVGDEERAHLAAHAGDRRFFDPAYGSCCKLIADVGRERFGFEAKELADLVRWADIIDAARFDSAAEALRYDEPAIGLMAVVEAHGGDGFLGPRIGRLVRGASLADLAADPEVRGLLGPIRAQLDESAALIRERAELRDGVLAFDLGALPNERYNKFLPYALYPAARYTVGVTAGPRRTKVSVGYNPWSPAPREHEISALCARHGGGGHPQVGAVSLPPNQLEEARQVAGDIIHALRHPPE